jgi:hypothetical protein
MRRSDVDILLVPGLGDSGPDHWQSLWHAELPTARRIEQIDWDRPQFESWKDQIIKAVNEAERPVIFVAHSLGVWAAVHSSPFIRGRIAGGFFVAPPSRDAILAVDAVDRAFATLPPNRLTYPSVIIASRDDPYAAYADSCALAQHLGADLVDAGNSGHITADSGHGPWPEGLLRFAGFIQAL